MKNITIILAIVLGSVLVSCEKEEISECGVIVSNTMITDSTYSFVVLYPNGVEVTHYGGLGVPYGNYEVGCEYCPIKIY